MNHDQPQTFVRRGSVPPPVSGERIVLGEGTDAQRLANLERALAGMVPMIDNVVKAVAAGGLHGAEERSALGEGEVWWTCSGCKKRLGIVNNATGELRIRHDGGRFLYLVSPGVGGTVKTACNGCGTQNTLKDTR